jgi:hypothetical protein
MFPLHHNFVGERVRVRGHKNQTLTLPSPAAAKGGSAFG